MSDVILSLPHYHRHIPIYVVQIIDTILGRMCLLRICILYCCTLWFDKHLYLTSCLNAHDHNTCICLPPNRLNCAKNGTLHYQSRLPNTTTFRRCHGNHHNNRLKFIISVILCTGKVSIASACNTPSDNITEIRYLGTVRLLQQKNKIWTSCLQLPQPRFRARDLHALLLRPKSVMC